MNLKYNLLVLRFFTFSNEKFKKIQQLHYIKLNNEHIYQSFLETHSP